MSTRINTVDTVLSGIASFSLWLSAWGIKLGMIYSIFGENKCFTQVFIKEKYIYLLIFSVDFC